jgi:transcriptional regulator with XRE-family HTH domain
VLRASKFGWFTASMAGRTREPGPTALRTAENLRRIRQERGLSYAELARRLAGLGHSIIDTGLLKIEKGERRVDVDDLVALAVALDVAPNTLMLPRVTSQANAHEVTEGGTPARAEELWGWALGEYPLGARPVSAESDPEDQKAEAWFTLFTRPYHLIATGLSTTVLRGHLVRDGAGAQGAAAVAASIVEAFQGNSLSSADIRRAVDAGLMRALLGVEQDPVYQVSSDPGSRA